MKIVVTGSNGFLGAWSSHLLSLESEVFCLTRPESDLSRLKDNPNLNIHQVPFESWAKQINLFKPDAIIFHHWNGVSGLSRNDKTQMLNTHSNRQLLNSIEVDCHLIGVGSQAELGPVSGRIEESQEDNPTTEYGRAKVASRKIFFDDSVNLGRKVNWVRIFSTYGPTDNPNWFIPSMIEKFKLNEEFNMTKGEQNWSYLHAYDAARAFRRIVLSKPESKIINLGNSRTVRLIEIAKRIAQKMKKDDLLKLGTVAYRPDQVMELTPVCETLSNLNWEPTIEMDEGLDQVINSIILPNFSIYSDIKGRR